MATWERVNGPPVLPPVYVKKVGRPPKSRRKQPHEVQGINGPKMSRHGVIIKCGYFRGENHNAKGCYLKKMRIRPEDYIPGDVPPVAAQSEDYNLPEEISMNAFASQPVMLTQDDQQGSSQAAMHTASTQQGSSQPAMLLSHMRSTMLMRMMEEVQMVTSVATLFMLHHSLTLFCRVLNRPTPITMLGLYKTLTSLVQTNNS